MREQKEDPSPWLESKEDPELRQLAVDLSEGRVYTDRHLPEGDDLGMVFMLISLGALSDRKQSELQEIGLIYEYLDQAAPRLINGLPSFFSMQFLNKPDTEKLHEYYQKLMDAKQEILDGNT